MKLREIVNEVTDLYYMSECTTATCRKVEIELREALALNGYDTTMFFDVTCSPNTLILTPSPALASMKYVTIDVIHKNQHSAISVLEDTCVSINFIEPNLLLEINVMGGSVVFENTEMRLIDLPIGRKTIMSIENNETLEWRLR